MVFADVQTTVRMTTAPERGRWRYDGCKLYADDRSGTGYSGMTFLVVDLGGSTPSVDAGTDVAVRSRL